MIQYSSWFIVQWFVKLWRTTSAIYTCRQLHVAVLLLKFCVVKIITTWVEKGCVSVCLGIITILHILLAQFVEHVPQFYAKWHYSRCTRVNECINTIALYNHLLTFTHFPFRDGITKLPCRDASLSLFFSFSLSMFIVRCSSVLPSFSLLCAVHSINDDYMNVLMMQLI